MKMKGQRDDAISLNQKDETKDFLKIVGVSSTINYFQIAYCLQCEVAKQLNFTKLHFYSEAQLINITISLAFELNNLANFSENLSNRFWNSRVFDFDTCIEQLETKMNWKLPTAISKIFSSSQTNLNVKQIQNIAEYLNRLEIYDEAIEFYQQLFQFPQCKCRHTKYYPDECDVVETHCRNNSATKYIANFRNEAETLESLKVCHVQLNNYDNALTFLNHSHKMRQNTKLNPNSDSIIATILGSIGRCHDNLCNYSDALIFLNRALDIFQNTRLNFDKDRNIAMILQNMGALSYFCLQPL